ncbi:MAG: gfo/Idh/MocA family oxidoreductase, partial [Planctomycetes bacterium]|nr:gfo/Idh/MocA family oxidoreductase [Planctomycetota bacterium]
MLRKHINRRRFLTATAKATVITIVPRQVLGGQGHTPPSEKLNIAGIGIGGMGGSNLRQLESENIVALCDVDHNYAAETIKRYPKAKLYS